MTARADAERLPADHPLRVRAAELNAATEEHLGPRGGPQTARRMLGAWARARRAWSEHSGEPLL